MCLCDSPFAAIVVYPHVMLYLPWNVDQFKQHLLMHHLLRFQEKDVPGPSALDISGTRGVTSHTEVKQNVLMTACHRALSMQCSACQNRRLTFAFYAWGPVLIGQKACEPSECAKQCMSVTERHRGLPYCRFPAPPPPSSPALFLTNSRKLGFSKP